MSEKTLKARLVNKHDIEVNWLKSSFVPKQGELVVFDIEVDADGNALELPEGRTTPYSYERIKIGDGITNVNDLPFATDGFVSYAEAQELTDDQKVIARENIGAKPEDVVANITGSYVAGTGVVRTCDKTCEELWTANEEGRDVIFNISGYQNVKGEFHNISTTNGIVREIHVRVFTTTGYSSYVIAEDNTITLTQSNLLNKNMIKQETGTSTGYVMSQKAVTDALDANLTAANTYTDEAIAPVAALVGDTPVAEQISTAITESVADWAETDETAPSYIKNKPDEDDALELVAELELATPVAASDGSIYTDENGVVYTL